jgi:anaphase-promoting complex subunit 8
LFSDTQKHVPSFNPYLLQLSHELLEAYQSDKLDAFGLYAYGMVLLAAKSLPPIRNAPTTQSILMKSILLFPYNWSAWLDLATCALDDASIEQEIEQSLQPILGGHFMYYFFCAHMQAERQAHAEALAIYERMLDPALFGASPYLMTQYALMQYHLRNISEAKRMLEDLHHHTPYRLDSMDVYSNILYVQNDSVGLSQLAHTAVKVDKYRPETCVIVGNYYSIKQQRAKAIQYFQRALKVDSNFTSAWTLMGHEYVEWKRTANAMEAYRRALHAAPNDYRAYYGLGQTYEILNMYMFALYYYKRATQLRPYDARMWCSLGVTFMQLGRPLDAIQAYERAMEQEDTEGVATQKLAALYKQSGQVEKAARCYLRYLELRYQATNTHGVTADDVSLDIMLHGLVVDGAEAEALLYLAHYHKEHGEYETSMIFCSRLLEYPGPEKDQAKGLLRELRQRSVTQARPAMRTRSKGPPASSSGFAFSP